MNKVASPCINICRLENNVCQGCYRTIDEISNWTKYTDQEKTTVLELVKIRQQKNPIDGKIYYEDRYYDSE